MGSLSNSLYNISPDWLQHALVSAYGYKLYRNRYMGAVYKIVQHEIERVNNMSASQHKAFQSERLYEMIKHCRKNIPYYSRLLAKLGLTEQDFTDTKHLIKLPVLEKRTIKENPEDFRPNGARPYMIQTTSGSTGSPLSVWVDEYTYKLAMALLVDHEKRHGVPFGARRATFAGRMVQPIEDMNPPFFRFNHAENQRIFSAYHINTETFYYYDKELEKFQPKELIGYPSAIYNIAVQYRYHKKTPNFKITSIITNSETLLEWQRETIESVFNCRVHDYYGTAEYVTFAGQCDNNKYHFNPMIGITEVIQNQDKIDSDSGNIISTSLTNKLMPLLRYRIGDTASLLGTDCRCGNPSLSTENILGRIDDVIITPDGRKIGRLDHIFKGLDEVKEAQIIQKSINKCLINVVANIESSVDENALICNLKNRIGEDINIDLCYLQSIPRAENGKFRAVINEIEME